MTQMIQANIDRPARDAIWQTMVTYTEGQINDDDLWDRLPPRGQEPFIAVMFNVLCSYTLGSDKKTNFCELNEEQALAWRRYIAFLQSDLPYRRCEGLGRKNKSISQVIRRTAFIFLGAWAAGSTAFAATTASWIAGLLCALYLAMSLRSFLAQRRQVQVEQEFNFDLEAWPFLTMVEADQAMKALGIDFPTLVPPKDRRTIRHEAAALLQGYCQGNRSLEDVLARLRLYSVDSDLERDIRLYLTPMPKSSLTQISNPRTKARAIRIVSNCIECLKSEQTYSRRDGSGRIDVFLAIMTTIGLGVIPIISVIASGRAGWLGKASTPVGLIAGLILGLGFAASMIDVSSRLPSVLFRLQVHHGLWRRWPFK